MRKILLPLLMLATLNCFGTPKIQFDATGHDFGKQPLKTEVKHVFTFTNTGTGTLVIKKVTAG
ncbi:MAG: DUF1573 domain-containing protein [Spirochaetes bacterium]|nr:DUF1573 domain-containing protein [Spirochaetota bacterium]